MLLKGLEPPANIEHRFVRLCNNFTDLVGFLSFAALGLLPSPSFCSKNPGDSLHRKHLSLSGIVLADMVTASRPPHMSGPMQTNRKAKRAGRIVWAEVETRAYIFGAVRNEPDPFVNAFMAELRARPDLFQVVTRSETDPRHDTQIFGAEPSEALPNIRTRSFEAPRSPTPPHGFGEWKIVRSAEDILYGTGTQFGTFKGYLTDLSQQPRGWFFHHKKFPVKYFAILDTTPYRDCSILARNVAWAALRAGKYGQGEYELRKYGAASDKLFEKCTKERLGWLPTDSRSIRG